MRDKKAREDICNLMCRITRLEVKVNALAEYLGLYYQTSSTEKLPRFEKYKSTQADKRR